MQAIRDTVGWVQEKEMRPRCIVPRPARYTRLHARRVPCPQSTLAVQSCIPNAELHALPLASSSALHIARTLGTRTHRRPPAQAVTHQKHDRKVRY